MTEASTIETPAELAWFEYPKIQTLFKRNPETFKVDETVLSMPEFGLVDEWFVTEKIHGSNIRVHWDGSNVYFGGRTAKDTSFIKGDLTAKLKSTFTAEKMQAHFGGAVVTMFGEGYGPGIQKGGGNYKAARDFALFDVFVNGYWFEPEKLVGTAEALDCDLAPFMGVMTKAQITALVKKGFQSIIATENTGIEHESEGVIARSAPGLFTRYGTRLMFKLKTHDFAKVA